MNKINYFIIGAVCGVLIAGMFAFVSAWSIDEDIRFAPSWVKAYNEKEAAKKAAAAGINANSCNADDTCEAITLLGKNANLERVTTQSIDTDSVNARGIVRGRILDTEQVNIYYRDKSSGLETLKIFLSSSQDINYSSGSLQFFDDRFMFENGIGEEVISFSNKEKNVRIPNLAGNGEAYVCVNSAGKLYRKLTPCR